MRGVRREGRRLTTAAVACAAVAPLLAQPDVRAEQVTQLVLGETALVLAESGPWRRLRVHADGYEGWAHVGYLRELPDAAAAQWRAQASGWSEGAQLDVGGQPLPLPLRARVALEAAHVRLPDGRPAQVQRGTIRHLSELAMEARRVPPEEWAAARFLGAPYQWGGVTPWGVDCSGLVQTTFAARGVVLPRDAAQQAAAGTEVPLDAIRPGDLLFFRGETTDRITHVAFAAAGGLIVHSAVARGGVVREPLDPLRERLVLARRVG